MPRYARCQLFACSVAMAAMSSLVAVRSSIAACVPRPARPLQAISAFDAAEQFVADECAHLLLVVEIPATRRTDQGEDAAREVVGGPFDVDAVAKAAGAFFPFEVRHEEARDERQRLRRLGREQRQQTLR